MKFTWEKLGKLFDPADYNDANWMRTFAQSPSTIEFDHHIRMYFCTRPDPSPDGQYLSFLSYIDLDKQDITKIIKVCPDPPLKLGELGTFDEFGTNPISVIRNHDEIRVYYAGWTRCESVPFNGAIGMAISRDNGDRFERVGPGPVLSYSPEEPFLIGSPRIRKFGDRWVLFYVAGKSWLDTTDNPEPVYKIRSANSKDGIHWIKNDRDLIPDKLDSDECQACPDVTFRDGLYHMFFSYRHSLNYKSKEFGYRIGYASSKDLLNWTREDNVAGMHTSDTGWDSEMVSYPHLFTVDGRTYLAYQGNGMGQAGIGVAKLHSQSGWSQS